MIVIRCQIIIKNCACACLCLYVCVCVCMCEYVHEGEGGRRHPLVIFVYFPEKARTLLTNALANQPQIVYMTDMRVCFGACLHVPACLNIMTRIAPVVQS